MSMYENFNYRFMDGKFNENVGDKQITAKDQTFQLELIKLQELIGTLRQRNKVYKKRLKKNKSERSQGLLDVLKFSFIEGNNDSFEVGELEPMVSVQHLTESSEAKQLEQDYEELWKLKQMLKSPGGSSIDDEFILKVQGLYENDRKFIEKAKDLMIPSIKQFQIHNLNAFKSADQISSVNEFLSSSITNKVETIVLSGAGWDMKHFRKGITNALDKVTHSAYFKWFTLEDDDIRTISKSFIH